jgi:hypothetical protein
MLKHFKNTLVVWTHKTIEEEVKNQLIKVDNTMEAA